MILIDIHDAEAQLLRLIEAVEAGEEVIITRAHRPIARLIRHRRAALRLGDWKLGLRAAPDWDSPETNAEVTALSHDDSSSE